MGHHRRALKRVAVTSHVEVRNALDRVVMGQVANLHEEGFMLIGPQLGGSSDAVILEGGLFQLEFLWRREGGDCNLFSLNAECLWTKPSETQLWSGFAIIEVSDDALAWIRDITRGFSAPELP